MKEDPLSEEPQTLESLRSAREETEILYEQLLAARREAKGLRAELDTLRGTRTFRYAAPARHLYESLRRTLVKKRPSSDADGNYDAWVQTFDTWNDHDLDQLAQRLARIESAPMFSVILPTYNTPESYLRSAVESVLQQVYTHLELCVADDHSKESNVRRVLEEYAQRDQRVKLIFRSENGGTAQATNSALDLARGDWVVFLDHDDVLPAHALARAAIEIDSYPEAQLIYTDEDHIDERGRRFAPMFKSDFDPVLLLSHNYICHLLVIRRATVSRVNGLRKGFEGSQDYDLVLRVVEALGEHEIRHIPQVLYHWRAHRGSTARSFSAKTYALDSSRHAVADHLERTRRRGVVTTERTPGFHRVRWEIPSPAPLVTVIIPTRDGTHLVRCLDSVLERTSYPRFDVIVVDNGSQHQETLRYLSERNQEEPERVKVTRDDRPFSFSALNNQAVLRTAAQIICLMNDDAEAMTAGWLEELVSQVLQPGVGLVGAKLYYPDGRIQHAGMVLGLGGGAGHVFRGAPGESAEYCGWAAAARTVSAVTAACTVVRREVWEAVGGLDENLHVSFNDVDFCLRAEEAGWRVIWTPHAELFHVDAATRGLDMDPANMRRALKELAAFRSRWGDCLLKDPYYSPNLSLHETDCSLAWPPRVEKLGVSTTGRLLPNG